MTTTKGRVMQVVVVDSVVETETTKQAVQNLFTLDGELICTLNGAVTAKPVAKKEPKDGTKK